MRYIFALFILILTSCNQNPIKKALRSKDPSIKRVKDSIDKYEVQILYTQIDTIENGEILFTDYAFQVDEQQYFYPASTVKLPVAVLAAEYADIEKNLSIDIPYVIDGDTSTHTIAQDIEAIFAVSDNDAYNRLYELLGRDYINEHLKKKGLSPARISHRLSIPDADRDKRTTIKFFPGYAAETITLENGMDGPIEKLQLKGIKKGSGVITESVVLNKPMNFSEKNYLPLEVQHDLMKRLVFPEKYVGNENFDLSSETRERLLMMMKTLPKSAGYDSKDYYDSYVKFFLFGDSKKPIPEHITIYNKVGYAYGTLTETAYIVDTKEHIRYLLSATILVNKNGIFNDDTYEYESIGIPFLAQLGREIHNIEKKRRK